MNYYYLLECVILEPNPKEKIKSFKKLYSNFLEDNLKFENDYTPYEMINPSYYEILNIIPAKSMPKIKYLKTKEGKINLLHTVAHIEYSAIDLALDAALRYKNMPREYYKDWLEVANDEVRHFLMLEELLEELGTSYGDLDVHTGLFDAMKSTPDLLSRMAVVPRYLEANGLEHNPKIMDNLKSNLDEFNKKILKVLSVILEEEVDHVTKGDRWFKYECKKLNLEPEENYFRILEEVYPGCTQRKYELNIEARKKAGFSCDELKFLSKKEDCN